MYKKENEFFCKFSIRPRTPTQRTPAARLVNSIGVENISRAWSPARDRTAANVVVVGKILCLGNLRGSKQKWT